MLDFLKSKDYKDTQSIEQRLIRIESRVVQIMNHMGIKPIGAKTTEEKRHAKNRA